jgi:Cu(I)/Ag(I) efflux system membrane protein CusA/SilA
MTATRAGLGGGGGGGAMAMGGGGAEMREGAAPMPAAPPAAGDDDLDRFALQGGVVPLGVLAEVKIVSGPPMIKDENGLLAGYVFVDVDTASRDLGGYVSDAKRLVAERLTVPGGYQLVWTGQYELLEEMQARLRWVLPLTLALIVVLLWLSVKAWQQTALVLLSLPFALAGSIWLLAARDYNLSTAVWVGIIAVGGVAAQTGTVIIVYLDEAIARRRREGTLRAPADVDAAIVEGAARFVRPLVMTVATTVLGLAPLLLESGVGADVSARTAAPVVGGLWSCMLLTLLVLPAADAIWRRRQLAAGRLGPLEERA